MNPSEIQDFHHHEHAVQAAGGAVRSRPFYLVLVLNLGLFAASLGLGILTHSLALISNAFHLLSDLGALGVGALAAWASSRPASARHSFGMVKAEVLGALVTTLLLIGVSVAIVYAAVMRLIGHHLVGPLNSGGLDISVVGVAGVLVNLVSLFAFAHQDRRSALVRANLIHFFSDGIGWVLALIAGLSILRYGFVAADPLASIAVSVLVIVASVKVLLDVTNVLMDAVPNQVDADEIRHMMLEIPGVEDVHHLHVWNLSSTSVALSAHLVMHEGITLHEAQVHAVQLKELLAERFGISHATLEMECHVCEEPDHSEGVQPN
ncbi:MAG: cation diffusion facilitator family transporter [Actinomycetota bacterium]|nr:cation diffusion facilitator family transporter [Actinomycetota bacterium]